MKPLAIHMGKVNHTAMKQHMMSCLWASLILIAMAACTPRVGEGNALLDYVDVDFTGLDTNEYRQALRVLTAATKLDLHGEVDDRSRGPVAVLAFGGDEDDDESRHAVLVARGERDAMDVAYVDRHGQLRWSEELRLGTGWQIRGVSLADYQDSPLLVVDLIDDRPGRPLRRLSWALTARRPVLVRIEDASGHPLLSRLATDHPQLPVGGRVESDDPIQQLGGLLALAAPDQAARRGRAGVLSHLQRLAASTDLWVAQIAAEVLTLPQAE